MITTNQPGLCPKCEARLNEGAEFRSLQGLVQIGSPVLYKTSRPVMRTEYKYYQCPTCGEIWCHVVDSGFSGHGSFLHLMKF